MTAIEVTARELGISRWQRRADCFPSARLSSGPVAERSMSARGSQSPPERRSGSESPVASRIVRDRSPLSSPAAESERSTSMSRRCVVNSKRRQQLWDVVSPLLAPGEQVQVMAAAGVGTVTVKRQLATAVAVGVATGGLLTAMPAPRQMYLAVTDRRILFFDGTGAPGK